MRCVGVFITVLAVLLSAIWAFCMAKSSKNADQRMAELLNKKDMTEKAKKKY